MAAPAQLHDPSTTTYTRIQHKGLLRTARIVWVIFAALATLFYVANFALYTTSRAVPCTLECAPNQIALERVRPFLDAGIPFVVRALYVPVIEGLVIVVFLVTGVVIFLRRSDDWMALLSSAMLIALPGVFGSSTLALFGQDALTWRVPTWGIIYLGMCLAYTFIYVYPDGRFIPGFARWILGLTFIAAFIFAYPTNDSNLTLYLMALILAAVGILFQIYRYRHVATPAQRQQVKWVLLALGLLLWGLLLRGVFSTVATPNLGWVYIFTYFLSNTIFYITLLMLPLALAFSIFRYRIWEVDLVVNRSLVYAAITLFLGIVFFIGIFLFQALLQAILGGEQSTLAAVISTALVIAAFNPAQRWMKQFVDRRFYHLRVDLDRLAEIQKAKAAPAPLPPDKTGSLTHKTLGNYQLGALLGKGGMGEVYRGVQLDTENVVAVKVLLVEFVTEANFLKRFEREAKVVAGLRHPNIVQLFDYGNADNTHYMVMEYIDGHGLGDLIRESGSLSLDSTRQILDDIAAALDYAHEQGLIHRDIKPSNIMLKNLPQASPAHRAILMDFGIAKIADDSTSLTQTGMMGTLDYVAPEQILDAKQVDRRADIYALGVMLYQMLTGETPFKGGVGQLVFAHLQQPPPDPRNLRADISDSAAAAILRAMSKQPDERFTTAGELAQAFNAAHQ